MTEPLSIKMLEDCWERMCEKDNEILNSPRYEFTFRCCNCKVAGMASIICEKCPICGFEELTFADAGYEFLGWYKAKDLLKSPED